MKKQIKTILKHPLIYGSSVIVFGNLFANFFNFLYNIFMARNLSVPDYGTLLSLTSLISLPILLSTAITPTVVQFAGKYFATNDTPHLRGLYLQIKKFYFILSVLIVLFFLSFISVISNFFHIADKSLMFISSLIILVAFMGGLNMAFLQAKLVFGFQVFVSFINASVKLLLGAIFVYSGYALPGATVAILLSGAVGYIISFFPLRFIFNRKIATPKIEAKSLFAYGLPSALASIGLTSFISADIILVKHFFDPVHAGLYAGLSIVGRIIFYVASPIGSVMFPVIIQKHSKNENTINTFKFSLLLIFVPSVILTILYFLFPDFFVLAILKKKEYLSVSSIIGYFGIYICLYGLVYIISTFYLAIKKTNVYIPLLVGALLQIGFIWFYHNSFIQILTISITIMFLLVVTLLLYYPYATKR